MNKNTASRTVTTTNFVTFQDETQAAAHVWTPAQAADAEYTLDLYTRAHIENDLDANGYWLRTEVFEYEYPGLKVIALMIEGAVLTVFTVEDDTAARLHKAVRREQPVTITYTKTDGEETVRTIEPTSLATTKTGAVIVRALDRKSAEARSFRLDRVSTYTVHRTRRTVRTEAPAPTKAELWEAWTAHQREFVPVLDNLTGAVKQYPAAAYRELTAARDPREPKAADEALAYS